MGVALRRCLSHIRHAGYRVNAFWVGLLDNFLGVVVANSATTAADGKLEQESNLQILKKCSSGRQKSYANKKGHSIEQPCIHDGGDEGDRTPDLLTASQALSQLSYAPVTRRYYRRRFSLMQGLFFGLNFILTGFSGQVLKFHPGLRPWRNYMASPENPYPDVPIKP